MPTSSQNILKNEITLSIKKSIERVKKIKNPTIVDIINALNSDLCKKEGYRMIDFSYASLCKCLIFKELKGIRFQTELVEYLKTHKRERKKLGLKRTPDQTTISHFINHVMDKETKKRISYIVEKIENISGESGIILDIKQLQPEKKKATGGRNRFIRINKRTKEVGKLFRKKLMPFFNLKLHHNCIYDKKDFINILIYMERERDFAENGAKTLREDIISRKRRCSHCNTIMALKSEWSEEPGDHNIFSCRKCGLKIRISPNGETLLYHLKKLDIHEIQRLYLRQFEILWDMAKNNNLFKKNRLAVAIDTTDIPFFGKINTHMIRGTKNVKGTYYCYKYMTISVVEAGKRFTLLALPYGPLDDKHEMLTELLDFARKRIRISVAVLDRAFFDSKSIKIFNRMGIKFITPCTEYYNIKKMLEILPAPFIVNNCKMKGEKIYNMLVTPVKNKKGKMVKYAYATNINLNETELDETINYIVKEYKKRWGIETSYRVKKHTFWLLTTSRNYRIRFFYFLFSVLMYNLWILADILVWLEEYNSPKNYHLVTSKYFRCVFFIIDSGG